MANIIQLKRRGTGQSAGAPSSLKSGEIAYNMTDGILYIGYGDDGGGNATSIKAIAKHDYVEPGSLFQPIDTDLTALAALATTGIVARTGAGAVSARTITGNAGRVTLTNGDGVAGNPTIDLETVSVGSTTTGGSTKFTVDAYGRITNASAASLTDIGSPTTSFSFGNQRLTNLLDPSSAQDAATKNYVDNAIMALDPKASVRVASTGNITVSAPGSSIDGVTLSNGDRVLLKSQTAPAENGIYIFNGFGTPMTRASDMDAWTKVPGAYTFVEQGTTNADTAWLTTADQGGTLGTTSITMSAFGAGTTNAFNVAGAGLTANGLTIDVVAGTGITTASDVVALTGQALALHNVTTAADMLIYATGSATFGTTSLTTYGRSLIGSADAAAGRSTLGLGTIATQNASAVTITGGTIDGVTLDGGTF